MNIELCWNITSRCNQNCKYCHRFLNIKELNKQQNLQILSNIIDSGIDNVTFTGGEALLIDYLDELIRLAKENNLSTKLITNGILFNKNFFEKVKNHLDYLNFSIDSLIDETNYKLGRGANHYNQIKKNLDMVSDSPIKLTINSVVSKVNYEDMMDLCKFVNKNKISSWRIFKFMPLRETAEANKDIFEIAKDDFDQLIANLRKISQTKIETREIEDFEKKYLLILANGDIVITKNNKDFKLGNALTTQIGNILKNL